MDRILTEILDLAQQLVRMPTVSVGGEPRWESLRQAADFLTDFFTDIHMPVRRFDAGEYTAILAGFPGRLLAPAMLGGHYDVVAPDPDDSQFEPVIDGDYLCGRGAADMKTVVSTYLIWMKHRRAIGEPYPPVSLLLVGNEERGEDTPMGTPHVFAELAKEGTGSARLPQFFIAGERTGETGCETWGEICVQNRGVVRFELVAYGRRGHSGLHHVHDDLNALLMNAQIKVRELAASKLTLASADGWQSQLRFPFIQVGERGVYNITADTGVLGVELRPIPGDDLEGFSGSLQEFCESAAIQIRDYVGDPGIVCDEGNPYLKALVDAVEQESGKPARFGKKLAGTSARFAPGGNGVVWGQAGLRPHAADERHYIPSILPYYRALDRFADLAAKVPVRPHP